MEVNVAKVYYAEFCFVNNLISMQVKFNGVLGREGFPKLKQNRECEVNDKWSLHCWLSCALALGDE